MNKKRIISLFMTLVLCFSLLPLGALAADEPEAAAIITEDECESTESAEECTESTESTESTNVCDEDCECDGCAAEDESLCPAREEESETAETAEPDSDGYAAAQTLPVLTGDYATDIVAVASSQIGYNEGGSGTVYGAWWKTVTTLENDFTYEGWCAMFACWCANQAGLGMGSAYDNYSADPVKLADWYKANATYDDSFASAPRAGDFIFFSKNGEITHVAIVKSYDADTETIVFVGGNQTSTAAAATGTEVTELTCMWQTGATWAGQLVCAYGRPSNSSSAHSHSYTLEYEEAHPHRQCMKCSCGDYYYTGERDTSGLGYSFNAEGHWAVCTCGFKSYLYEHTLTSYIGNMGETVWKCGTCDYTCASGKAGSNITWELDYKGNLTVSGTGKFSTAGWGEHTERISNVVIGSGITTIGNGTFDDCCNLKTITLPESLTCIESEAFIGCDGLQTVSYEGTKAQWAQNVSVVSGNDCFSNATLRYLKSVVTFNPNGGSDGPGTGLKNYGEAYTIPTSAPTKTGYKFLGWATESTATEAQYLPGESYTILASTYLFAVWQKLSTSTITFNVNGGTGGPGTGTKIKGVNYTVPTTTPTRTGYTFLGWAGSKTATTAAYQPGKSYSSIYLTLYAVWKINTYTVTYNANGGTGAPASGTKTYGKAYTLSTTIPARTGYTFMGWATSSTATAATYKAGASYTKNAAVKLYAVWAKNSKITFNANGGTGGPGTGTKIKGVNYTVPTTKPTRTGYTFQGWAGSKTATTATYLPGKSYSSIYLTLYAVWKANVSTITFNANGGKGGPSTAQKTYGKAVTIPTTKPTRTGYTFMGWASSKNATKATYLPGKSYSSIHLTLYAVWAKNSTVTFNANGGTGGPKTGIKVSGQSFTVPTTKPTRTGYTFVGWSNLKSATTAKYLPGKTYSSIYLTLYAVWKKN